MVLVVEDQPFQREYLLNLFRERGVQYLVGAGDGAEALKAADRVEAGLRAHGVSVRGVDYLDRALLHLAGDLDDLAPAVAEITSGAGILQPAGTRWVDRPK